MKVLIAAILGAGVLVGILTKPTGSKKGRHVRFSSDVDQVTRGKHISLCDVVNKYGKVK